MCCFPLAKRQPSHFAQRAGLYGQSKRFERIGFGTFTSMPPTASMRSLNPSKSTTTTWSIGSPVERLDGRERQRRAADLVRGVDLRRSVARYLHAEISRDREVRDPVRAWVEVEEHQRVRAVGVLRAPPRARRRFRSRGSWSARRAGSGRVSRAGAFAPRGRRSLALSTPLAKTGSRGRPTRGRGEGGRRRRGRSRGPTTPAPSARSGRTCWLRRLARRASEWDSALLAAAAIQPVGLVSLGHRGRYGSPAVRPSGRHWPVRGRPRRCRSARPARLMPLAVCATPIGNLADVTLRVLEELGAADLVLCEDTRHTRILLERHGITARLSSYHRHNEAARAAGVLERLRAGERVALVSDAGLPGINDPGARLIAAASAEGIEVTVLPGASAVETALVVSGVRRLIATSSSRYLPRRAGELRVLAGELRSWPGAVVAFESPRRLASVARRACGRAAGTVGRRLPRAHETLRGVVRGSLEELTGALRSSRRAARSRSFSGHRAARFARQWTRTRHAPQSPRSSRPARRGAPPPRSSPG